MGGADDLLWIPKGRAFTFDDLVWWSGKEDGRPFEAVARRISTVVLGPHASAAFPEELKDFIAPTLTRRKQHDFSDAITGPVGRAWAAADPHVVFVENPHSRVALDANRRHEADLAPALRECFARLRRQRAGESGVTFAGVDGVRPVTFSGEDVLLEPELGLETLVAALDVSAAHGIRSYQAASERVISAVRAARPGAPLAVIGLHDTSNSKMRADGAIVVERPVEDRLPALVNFGNLGDFRGEPSGEGLVLCPGDAMRRIAAAWSDAFGQLCEPTFATPAEHACDEIVSFNRPYAGGFEVQEWARRLRAERDSTTLIFQIEFERDALLGPAVAAALREPGDDWPAVDHAHVIKVAACLKAACDRLASDATK
jgi:hypothetical protein